MSAQDGRSTPETAGQAAYETVYGDVGMLGGLWHSLEPSQRERWEAAAQAAIAAAAPAGTAEAAIGRYREQVSRLTADNERMQDALREALDARQPQADMFVRASEGDTVVVGFRSRISMKHAHEFRERFAAVAPGVKLALVDNVESVDIHDTEQPQAAPGLAAAMAALAGTLNAEADDNECSCEAKIGHDAARRITEVLEQHPVKP